MNALYLISLMGGLGFFFFGFRSLRETSTAQVEQRSNLAVALILFGIGAVALIIGLSGLLGFYLREAPAALLPVSLF